MPATPKRSKTALVLASGGVTGVAYEVGALRALDHVLTNRTVNDFDIYVGTSAGAVVASALASGLPPIVLAGLLAGTIPGFTRLNRLELYRPNFGEIISRLGKAPGLLRDAAADYWRHRDRMPVSEAIYSLAPLLPSGIFSNGGLENYVRETFRAAGLSDDFRDIPKELHIIAADLEADARVDFSRFEHPDVPISRAVAASTCIPILFKPVEIDGKHYVDGGIKGHAAIDIAISRGAKLIVIVNGLVPLDTEAIRRNATTAEAQRSIVDLGIRAVGNQVLRGMLHDTLLDHLRAVRDRSPDVDFVVIEPRPDDEKMFFHEVMSFSAQMIVMQHGYETVVSGLHKSWPYLSRILPKHGIEITRRVVDKKPVEVPVNVMERSGNMLGRLSQTVLDRRSPSSTDAQASVSAIGSAPRRKPTPKAPAKGRSTAARRRGQFRPRVISSDR